MLRARNCIFDIWNEAMGKYEVWDAFKWIHFERMSFCSYDGGKLIEIMVDWQSWDDSKLNSIVERIICSRKLFKLGGRFRKRRWQIFSYILYRGAIVRSQSGSQTILQWFCFHVKLFSSSIVNIEAKSFLKAPKSFYAFQNICLCCTCRKFMHRSFVQVQQLLLYRTFHASDLKFSQFRKRFIRLKIFYFLSEKFFKLNAKLNPSAAW